MLHPFQFYHLYNHANGNEDLFREEKNYYFFLEKVNKYLKPYMNIYAYCLMPNHFHLLISIKEEKQLYDILSKSISFKNMSETNQVQYMYNKISKSLSNLFSSYTQSYNRIYQRRGSLFMPNFKTNDIEDDLAFCAITHYIHANPVHHGFVKDIREWKFSSFKALCSEKPTKLERNYVLEIFGNEQAFLNYHAKPVQNINLSTASKRLEGTNLTNEFYNDVAVYNAIGTALSQQYASTFKKIDTQLDPREFEALRTQIKELKAKKGY